MSEHPNLLKSVLIFTNPKGQHNSSLAYQKMDEVQHQTSIYVATENIPAGVAISDARWAKKLDNSTAYQAELARQTAEGEREQAEDSRETAEGLREQGEIDRGNAYSQAELARDGLYATAESARDDLFTGSQQDRTSAYNLRENQRDDAYDAAELARGGLYESAESARDGLYENAEASREQAFEAAEIERNQTLAEGIEAGRLNYKGPYNPSTLYSFNNWVTDSGSSYAYINATPAAGIALSDASHWQQIASRGMTGPSAYDAAVAGGYAGTEAEFNVANAGIEAAKDSALGAAETANEAAENAETAAYRSMLWRKTPSGNPVSVYPVPESPLYPKVSGTFTQAGTGDPSPENIRPITPWLTSGGTVKVKRTGKNLSVFPYRQSLVSQGVTFTTNADGSVTANGTAIATAYFNLQDPTGALLKLKAGSYYLSGATTGLTINLSSVTLGSLKVGAGRVTLANDISDGFVFVKIESGVTVVDERIYPQLELGSAATPYEPYTGADYDLLTAEQDFYGLPDAPVLVDAEAGTVTVQDYGFVLTGVEVWVAGTTSGGVDYKMTISESRLPMLPKRPSSSAVAATMACSHYPTKSADDTHLRGTGCSLSSSGQLAFYDPAYNTSDVSLWKAFLAAQYAAGTPVTILYQLATPITIPITPPSIPALPQLDRVTPRQNVLTASTGNVELTYAKSPIREADELAAAIAALS